MESESPMESVSKFDFPADLHYEPNHHFWARYDPVSGQVTVGLDQLGLQVLGELAYVALPTPGETVARGDAMGTLEAAKMTTELIAPVSGTVLSRNEDLLRDPSPVNSEPYDGGWMVVLEPSDWIGESEALIGGDAVDSWIESEIERFRQEELIE